MIMNSYPFDSLVTADEHGDPIYDRAVSSTFLQELQRKDRSYGVVMLNNMGDMKVAAGTSGLTVTVNPGYCFIRGCYGWYNEAQTLTLDPAVNNDRIDAVTLRLNTSMDVRGIELVIKKGTEAANPTPPAMQKYGSIWELGLANVRVKKGASGIEQQYIEDTRANPLRCGISTPMQEIDTSMLYDQIQDQITKNIELIQHALDDTMAGYLQNQIDQINAKFPPINTTLTRLDTEINDLNIRLTGVDKRTLIWENARTGSNFAKQTISIDLSNYTQIEVWILETTGNNAYMLPPLKVFKGKPALISWTIARNDQPGNLINQYRRVEATASDVKFDDCWFFHRDGGAVANWYNIPYRIYGIKGA